MKEQQLAGQSPARSQSVQTAQAFQTSRSAANSHDYAYYKEVFAGRRMPFAYLDLDLLDQNIQQIVAWSGGKRIRLASKSLRCIWAIRYILAANPCFQGLMCYSAHEAVHLASLGLSDLLIGYPIYHSEDIAAVAQATAQG